MLTTAEISAFVLSPMLPLEISCILYDSAFLRPRIFKHATVRNFIEFDVSAKLRPHIFPMQLLWIS